MLALLGASLLVTSIALGDESPDAVSSEIIDGEEDNFEQDDLAESKTEIDGSIDDAEGTIGDPEDRRRWSIKGDLRLSYAYDSVNLFEEIPVDRDVTRLRWRLGGSRAITDRARVGVRIAGLHSTEEWRPDFIFDAASPTPTGIKDGQITFDELFVHWYQNEQFDLAVGRLQTKFVARGGVFAKSLDRNDSNNLRVNWTDGLHGTYKAMNGWATHLILQGNSSDGASTVRRYPLDFSDSASRVTTFLAFENLNRDGFLIQRGFDISYLPDSLLKDGTPGGPVEDYWGFVGRAAGRWPRREGPRLRVSGEVGFAPNTQTSSAATVTSGEDVDGWAWNFTASIMDFKPRHNIGINYARTAPGWLLSPQYGNNEELFEIRYMWRRNSQFAIDVRGRWRGSLDELAIGDGDWNAFDFYFRLTRGFNIKRSLRK